ncbi:heavy metal translocating P-type ATPase [Massilia rubra]|uniref:Cadmium-translocating P-type ATPase n=1 Tax=Massilia rubra TaxID=2607910 RepID=A0ABX0LXK9_9BURK|nr:heavy metal translocating P-type ATPase [Massilia rubra]NHZ37488.1 cadmium-translocating P-type ATPase [Massilia rubra]
MSAQPFATACYHCGLPVALGATWSVRIDGQARPMCCPGCEAVAHGIVEAGLADYYRTRSVFADRAEGVELVPPELALYDSAVVATQGEQREGEFSHGVYSLDGIRCAACVWLIERRLARLPGVREAQVNVATERLHMTWDAAACKPSDIVQALRGIGYTAYPYEAALHGAKQEKNRKKQFRQLFVAGLSMMQVMMYALPAYIAEDGTMDAPMAALMQWASLLLTIPAVLYSAQPFFKGAWASLRARMPGMDLPVAIGIGAAFGASVLATLRGTGEVYYDSVTMFIFLLLASRYLEMMARRKAARALEDLQRALPAAAQRLAGWPTSRQATMVAAASLAEGDVILVEPGSAVAADGIILEGHSDIDLALLTGESRALARVPGDELPGGAINTTQAIVLRVTRVASDSTLARLVKLVEKAGQGKPRIAQWADQVAAWFVVGLLLLTVAVFIGWQMVDPARAWQVAIAVLVVSCPCALSLATPTALAAATDALVRRGVLVVQPHVLETLQRATHIVFDKTGTLTEGRPVLRHVEPLATLDAARCLQLAAALEAGSAHPLALAIRNAAPSGAPHATELHSEAGQGVEGTIDGVRYRLGRDGYAGAAPAPRWPDVSNVYLGVDGVVLARFELADALRADAPEVVRRFKARGQSVILLSGDDQGVVSRTGAALGIETAIGQQLPEQKLAYVQQLQAQGAVVAMVGDGINDAAVLRAADVSFAMGGGAALAQLSADCVLLSNRLTSLDDAALGAARALRIIRQNLAWASVYNCVAIPAAAFGLINPWLSAAGMSLSSAVVVINALRLRRARTA